MKLEDNLETQNRQIAFKHCIDIKMIKIRFFSALAKIQGEESFKPIRINNEGKFILPMAEILFQFFCPKNSFCQ